MSAAKKVQAPIMGVREWVIGDRGELLSTGVGGEWGLKAVQRAKCRRNPLAVSYHYLYDDPLSPQLHPAPHAGCTCGLYAFYDLATCAERGDGWAKGFGTRGVVSAWGRVIRSEYGFKAEYMKLEAIIAERPKQTFWMAHSDMDAAHKTLSDKHGVPILKPEEVSAFMGLSGGTILEPAPELEVDYDELRMPQMLYPSVATPRTGIKSIKGMPSSTTPPPPRPTLSSSSGVDPAALILIAVVLSCLGGLLILLTT